MQYDLAQVDEKGHGIDRIEQDLSEVEAEPVAEPERPLDACMVHEPAAVAEALRPPLMPWERDGSR